MKGLTSVLKFLKADIWRLRETERPPLQRAAVRTLRVLLLTLHGFTEDKIHLRASALTFYTLLSIVPILAMTFGVAKGFGFKETLQTFILERLAGQEEVAHQIVDFAEKLLENVKGGLVAGIGLVILLYTVLKILSHIENAFNDIWGVDRPRTLGRKITDYFSLVMVCPVFFVVSSTASVILTSGVREIADKIWLFAAVSPAIFFSLKLLPVLLLWILFTFLYIFMPNTRVLFTSGMTAGIVAGTLQMFFQRTYIGFQVTVSSYNAIYGSFAALPLFFIWLQFSWIIVLLGAEIAYACQNHDSRLFEKEIRTLSQSAKRLLSLRVVHFLIGHFSGVKTSWAAAEIAKAVDMPEHLVRDILGALVKAGIVSRMVPDDRLSAVFQPARDPDTLTVKSVIDALDQCGDHEGFLPESETLEKLSRRLKAFSDLMEASPANQRIKEI